MSTTTPEPGHRPITLRDIANHCGLSTWTVSTALRGDTRVKPATMERVKQAAETLGYDPYLNVEARELALRQSGRPMVNHMVALFYPTYFHKVTFYSRILQGVLDVFVPEGYAMVTSYLPDTIEKSTAIPSDPIFRRGLVDGLIAFSGSAHFELMVAKLRKYPRFAQKPIITLLSTIPGCSTVLTDIMRGGYLATQHLIELGHREVLLVTFANGFSEYQRRIAGVQQALREAGLDPEQSLHRFPNSQEWLHDLTTNNIMDIRALSYDPATEKHPLIAYLRAHPHVTAIETRNDIEALHVWELLTRAGFHVPEDISIIGFDDTDIMHDLNGENMLTSVTMPLLDVGRAAAKFMLARLSGETTHDEQIMLPVSLAQRKSTAPARRHA